MIRIGSCRLLIWVIGSTSMGRKTVLFLRRRNRSRTLSGGKQRRVRQRARRMRLGRLRGRHSAWRQRQTPEYTAAQMQQCSRVARLQQIPPSRRKFRQLVLTASNCRQLRRGQVQRLQPRDCSCQSVHLATCHLPARSQQPAQQQQMQHQLRRAARVIRKALAVLAALRRRRWRR